MTSNLSTFQKGILAIGAIGASYLLIKNIFQTKQKAQTIAQNLLSIQKTRQLIRQIKYQILIVCITYAQSFNRSMRKMIPHTQLQATFIKLKENIMSTYQFKERVVLQKHSITKQQFYQAIEGYQSDDEIDINRKQIQDMIQLASRGQYPDLSVNPLAMTVNSRQNIQHIYFDVCLIIATKVWKTMKELCEQDEAFNPTNDEHFKKAIKMIPIFQIKEKFLEQKGYNPQWGSPNQIFLKVSESFIKKDNNFRIKMRSLQKAYNIMIDILTGNPLTFKQEQIKNIFNDQIQKAQKTIQ